MKQFTWIVAALVLPFGAMASEPSRAAAPAGASSKDVRQCSMPSSPRLQKKGDECAEATERTRWHSREELQSTGLSNAEALRRLNPSIY